MADLFENPMGLMGFEFVEFASPTPGAMAGVLAKSLAKRKPDSMKGFHLVFAGSTGSGYELYDKAVNVVLQDKKVSTSYIQRRLAIGYNKAATLIERMEREGVISAANHAGKREILVGNNADGY